MPRRPGSIDVTQIDFQEAVIQNVSISGSLTLGSDLVVSQYIKHEGDANTLINFADDKIILKAGNKAMITMEEKNSAPHEVTINDGSNNIDFVVKGNGSGGGNPGMKFDASTNKLGINGIGSPDKHLHVGGSMKLDGNEVTIFFADDADAKAEIGINSSDNIVIENKTTNKHIIFKVNDQGVVKEGLRLDGAVPEVVVNQASDSLVDFRVESNNQTHMLFVDGSADKVGIGTDTPTTTLHVAGGLKIDEGQVTISATEKVNKKAISLDGTNDHILVSDQDDFSYTNGSSDLPFSLSIWVYVGDISSDDGPFISKANFSTGGTEFLFKHANGKLQFFLYDNDSSASGDSIRTQAPSATLSSTTWHHVVATYSGNGSQTGMKVYTDGSQTTSTQSENGSYSRLRNTSTPLVIGATQDLANANRVFEDRLADCVIFNKELSSSEVTEIYNSGKVMNMRNHSAFANVVSWWKMGDDQDVEGSNGIRDYVSGYHGTLTNGASIIDETGLSSDTLDSLNTNTSGSLGIGIESPDESLHVYGNTKLEGPLILRERTYDPDDPAEGGSVIWMSNGNGTGDDGDILIKITAGGSTKTVTLVDFSAS